MSSTISIRQATPEDLNTVGFLAQQIWPETYRDILSAGQLSYMLTLFYSPASLRKQMMEQGHMFLMAEEGEKPVGFASYSQTSTPGLFKLHKIYVLPGQQGKGLGRALLDFIREDIRSRGATRLQLNVNRHNPACRFYEKLGFRISGQEDIDIGATYFMNDYIMELTW